MSTETARRQRRSGESAPGISLFPFLAVLICTMGALVPLLFAVTRQARSQAAQAAACQAARQQAETHTERKRTQWRIEQLQISREKTQSQLADLRLELGHIENHSQRLQDQLSGLEKTVADLDHLGVEDAEREGAMRAEREQVRARLGEARRQVSDARAAAAARKKSYAILPYEGPYQTHRRPIYIECRADAVILQPEGIVFREEDFEGPAGPSNPLAVALRTTREFFLQQRQFDPQKDGEPYPLLLVRPDGIEAYYAARAAMQGWGSEFGYELIDADWRLAFPPRDPVLAQTLEKAAADAREIQRRLLASSSHLRAGQSGPTYRVSPVSGGVIREGGYSDDDEPPRSVRPGQPGGSRGPAFGSFRGGGDHENQDGGVGSFGSPGGGGTPTNNFAGDQRPSGHFNSSDGGAGASGSEVAGTGTGAAGPSEGDFIRGVNNPYLALGARPSGMATNDTSTASAGSAIGGGNTGSATPGFGGAGNGGSLAGNSGVNGGTIGGSGVGVPAGVGGGNNGLGGFGGGGTGDSAFPGSNPPASSSDSPYGQSSEMEKITASTKFAQGILDTASGITRGGVAASSSGGGSAEPVEGMVSGRPTSQPAFADVLKDSPKEGGVPLRPGEWHERPDPPPKPPDPPRDSPHRSQELKKMQEAAKQRGKDWGLPDAARRSVPVSRPIQVECRPDQLVLLPEDKLIDGKTIPLGLRTETAINPFVSAVWRRMNQWGIAGNGMYWRPILKISVAPGAEGRFAELQASLAGSGLTIERR